MSPGSPGAPPRSALTTGLALLRQSSAELAREAAAVAENIAFALTAEHSETLAAMGLPDVTASLTASLTAASC